MTSLNQQLPKTIQSLPTNTQPTNMVPDGSQGVEAVYPFTNTNPQGLSASDGLNQVRQGANVIDDSISKAGSALGNGGSAGGRGSGVPINNNAYPPFIDYYFKKGGLVKKATKGKSTKNSSKSSVSSASKRGDGIAQRGKTRGRVV